MSTGDPSARDFIFVDGLNSKPRGTIRSHISRQVSRQRRIQKAQAYQNVPSSGLVGWQQKPQADDQSGHGEDPANPEISADATAERRAKGLPIRRYVMWEAGQARRRHSLPQLPPQQPADPRPAEHDPLEEDIASMHIDDAQEPADQLGGRRAVRERGDGYKPSNVITRRRRIAIDPAVTSETAPIDRICWLVADSVDPFHVFPAKMDPPTQRVLYRLLDDSPSNRFRGYRDAWFAHAASDSAAFKQFLSTFSLFLQRLLPSAAAEVGPLTVSLHTQALRSVNERIMRPTLAADEGLLVAIISFIAHYQLLEKYDAWQAHIRGLKDIILVCGGLERAFMNKKPLRNMLFFIDLQGSWLQDRPPHFPLPHDLLPDVHSLSVGASIAITFPLAVQMSTTWRSKFPQQDAIPSILDELATITAYLVSESNRTAGSTWTDSVATGLWVNPIVHRLLLLRIEELDVLTGIQVLQESFRIAALLHLGRIKFHSGLIAGLTRTHVARLRTCLSSGGAAHWLRLEPLKVWILVMGGINAEGPSPERQWFELELLKLARLMNMADWGRVEAMAKSVLWIDDLFHGHAEILWRDLGALEKLKS